MTTLESGNGATVMVRNDREGLSFPDLRPKRDAPAWVKTIVRADSGTVWSKLRAELPHPLDGETSLPIARATRFPELNAAVERASAVLAGQSSLKEAAIGGESERLELLVVLLDAFGRGEYPADDKALGEVWSWIWLEMDRLASPEAGHSAGDETDPTAWLRDEALLASGVYFAGLVGMRARAKEGRKLLWRDLAARVDSDGTPSSDLWDEMPRPLAALARCGAWADAGDLRWGKRNELDLCDGLARVLAAGLGPASASADERGFWLRALGTRLGWKKSDKAMRFLLSLADGTKAATANSNGKASQPKRSKGPTFQSEWGKVMVARTGWDRQADLLSIRHGGKTPFIECQVGGCPFLAGSWELEIRVDGEPVDYPPEWDSVSWFEDREVNYLELQVSDLDDLVICRQFLFARDNQQLWLADSVSLPQQPRSQIEIVSRLPLVGQWPVGRVPPTRELRFGEPSGKGQRVRCFPLAFPMDATWPASGRIDTSEGRFEIRQTGEGGVYSPLMFDWHGPHRGAAADWRPLTVTEDGTPLTAGQAAAARVRLGKRQWMVYRNLNGSSAMRAVLGYHHNQESVIGQFTSSGEIDPLVLVEVNDAADNS